MLLLLNFGYHPSVFASDDKFSRRSLVGLRGIEVVVEDLAPEVERAGLTKAVIQTDAELKLRIAGIRVLSTDQDAIEPGHPYLYLNAIIATGNGSSWGYTTSVGLTQTVLLVRNPEIVVEGETWSVASGGGYAASRDIAERVRNKFKDEVDEFINAYLAMNPKDAK
jgi:hypothetical protein